jgi:hypothetical protein
VVERIAVLKVNIYSPAVVSDPVYPVETKTLAQVGCRPLDKIFEIAGIMVAGIVRDILGYFGPVGKFAVVEYFKAGGYLPGGRKFR